MKRIISLLLSGIISIYSKIYTYGIGQRLREYKISVYTLWIKNFLGSIGRNSKIAYPCTLQGGGEKLIWIGDHSGIGHHCILGCYTKYGEQSFSPGIKIGNYCSIGDYFHIAACNKITIGDGLLTGRFVYIGDHSHGGMSWDEARIPPAKRVLKSKGEIIIGNNVWIGDRVTILGGVTIGDNTIVGAGTVLTHDVPPNTVVVGGKMTVIKQL